MRNKKGFPERKKNFKRGEFVQNENRKTVYPLPPDGSLMDFPGMNEHVYEGEQIDPRPIPIPPA